jgi:exodeoxyribonuclease VII large subunit
MKSLAEPGVSNVCPNPSTSMAKIAQTQWDFGELIPATPTSRRVLTVSELTGNIRRLIETQIGQVWVSGEVTNLRVQGSGHVYFTVKDASAQLQCVLFRGESVAHRELLQDGQKLLLQGNVSVYETRGQYQLIVRAIELQGLGALQIAFEKLKLKLQAEGLFAQERKRVLPKYPTTHWACDIRNRRGHSRCSARDPTAATFVASDPGVLPRPGSRSRRGNCRRHSNSERVVRFKPVALRRFDFTDAGRRQPRGSVGIQCRSGGARDFQLRLPVLSGVGHEIDFTISDFVAVVRAATPSAAAEIITEGAHSSRTFPGRHDCICTTAPSKALGR